MSTWVEVVLIFRTVKPLFLCCYQVTKNDFFYSYVVSADLRSLKNKRSSVGTRELLSSSPLRDYAEMFTNEVVLFTTRQIR